MSIPLRSANCSIRRLADCRPRPAAPVADVGQPSRRSAFSAVPQTVVTFSGPGIKRHDPAFMASYVEPHSQAANASRLTASPREARSRHSVYESLLWADHSAIFVGNTGTRADRAGGPSTPSREIRRIAERGDRRSWTRPSLSEGLANAGADTRRSWPRRCCLQLDQLPIDYIEKRNAIVDAVTLDEAKKAARRLGKASHRDRRPRPAAAQPAAASLPQGELTAFDLSRVPDAVQRLWRCAAS